MNKKGKFSEKGKNILKRNKLNSMDDFFSDSPNGGIKDIQHIAINEIKPNPNQARKYFSDSALEELSLSIKEKGVIQPILVRRDDLGKVILVAGERRLRASRSIGLEKIPVLFTSENPIEISLIENIQRENLSPLEEAEAFAQMVTEFKYTQKELSRVIGKARSTIAEILSLNKLPVEVKENCRRADIPKRTLIEIAKTGSTDEMIKLFDKVTSEKISSDQVRKITRIPKLQKRSSQIIRKIRSTYKELSDLQIKTLNETEYLELIEELNKLRDVLKNILS